MRRLGLWGGCRGRGKSLGSLIPKPPTHPYPPLDSQGSQHLRTIPAGKWAAGQLGPRTVGCFGKSVPARRRGGSRSVPNVGVSGYGQRMFQKVIWNFFKTKQNARPRRRCGTKCSISVTRPTERGLSESRKARLESQRAKPARLPLAAPHPGPDQI